MERNTMNVNEHDQLFDYLHLQNVYFCVQNKKETHTGLEQHEDE